MPVHLFCCWETSWNGKFKVWKRAFWFSVETAKEPSFGGNSCKSATATSWRWPWLRRAWRAWPARGPRVEEQALGFLEPWLCVCRLEIVKGFWTQGGKAMESLNEFRRVEWFFRRLTIWFISFSMSEQFVPVKRLNCPTSPLICDWKSRAGKLSHQERLSDHCNYH